MRLLRFSHEKMQLTACFLEVLLGALNHYVRSLTFLRPPCHEDVKPHGEAMCGQLNLQSQS